VNFVRCKAKVLNKLVNTSLTLAEATTALHEWLHVNNNYTAMVCDGGCKSEYLPRITYIHTLRVEYLGALENITTNKEQWNILNQ
jgi:hypothetical protein